MQSEKQVPLKFVPGNCCLCDGAGATLIGTGLDFEYRTAPDQFHAYRCNDCGTVILDPRPDVCEFVRIYPSSYHSLAFSAENYSFVHRIRSRLEANRLLRYCKGAPPDAKILDVGCGDGFHLRLLQQFGEPNWTLEGVDIDRRAVEKASEHGLTIHQGTVEAINLGAECYDVVYAIQTIEHVANPKQMLDAIYRLLKPGGRLILVTDNTRSMDFRLFKRRHWGGYHFPRHWYLFDKGSLSRLGALAGFRTERIDTIVSPVNWVYSIHNWLVDQNAPTWLIQRFTLKSPVSLGIFTIVDMVLQKFGRGALLNAYFEKPGTPRRVER
jgi:SAM-dependent methyltransferase